MKYLVLGSEGQIGKSLVKFLKNKNEEVFGFDIKNGYREDLRFSGRDLNINFISLLEKSDFVFFLAWDVGGSKYLEKSENTFDFLNNNISIMYNVFSYLNIHKKPFLFTSSQMSDMMNSIYGNTKIIGEKYTNILNGLCVKMWNIYGENDEEGEKAHAITDFIDKAKKNNLIDMITNGEESRQFLHANDCCEAFYNLSKHYDVIPRDRNLHVTSFKWYRMKEVAQEVARQMKCEWILGEKIDRVQNDKKIEPDKFILNYWEPKISLEKGISMIIEEKMKKKCI